MSFRKNQVLLYKKVTDRGVSKVKVFYMRPEKGVGRSKVQNLRTGQMFVVETSSLEMCDNYEA